MMHEKFRDQLDDYVDGALPEPERLDLERHAAACGDCAAELASLRRLLAAARELPPTLEPHRDLWPALQARIRAGAPEAARHVPWRAAVASLLRPSRRVALAGALAAALASLWLVRAPERHAADPTQGEDFPAVLSGLERECMGTGQLVQASLRAWDGAGGGGAAPLAAGVSEALPLVERSISEVQAALAVHPEDAALQRMLAARYQRKLALLQTVLRRAQEA